MPKIIINNQEHEIEGSGRNLLDVCLSLGYDVPYFCWHPATHSIGACRQCAVKQFKDENDTRGTIVMACMTPANDGARISTDDPQAVAFRKSVIEWLMVNHPHDCPVCDEGGECHLQDMTVMTGHDYRRYRFTKRTHRNQDLGPFVNHEMNRCIQCYRCVRFYRDYARRARTSTCSAGTTTSTSGASRTGLWRTSSAATSWRSARRASSPTRPSRSTTRASGTCSRRRRCACTAGWGATPSRASDTGRCAACAARFNGEVNGYFLLRPRTVRVRVR